MTDEIKTTAEAYEEAILPAARAVHCTPCEPGAEDIPLPRKVASKPVEQKSPAQWAYERVILYLKAFEDRLDNEHEVAMGFAGGDAGVLRIEGIGHFDPDIITFYGSDPSGAKTQLVQHVSQLKVFLRAIPKDQERGEPNRIGFRLAADLDAD